MDSLFDSFLVLSLPTPKTKEKQSVSRLPSTLIEITDSQGFSLPHFPPDRTTSRPAKILNILNPKTSRLQENRKRRAHLKTDLLELCMVAQCESPQLYKNKPQVQWAHSSCSKSTLKRHWFFFCRKSQMQIHFQSDQVTSPQLSEVEGKGADFRWGNSLLCRAGTLPVWGMALHGSLWEQFFKHNLREKLFKQRSPKRAIRLTRFPPRARLDFFFFFKAFTPLPRGISNMDRTWLDRSEWASNQSTAVWGSNLGLHIGP